MNYKRILQGILDIGEAMLKSGAENFRLEDSWIRWRRNSAKLRRLRTRERSLQERTGTCFGLRKKPAD